MPNAFIASRTMASRRASAIPAALVVPLKRNTQSYQCHSRFSWLDWKTEKFGMKIFLFEKRCWTIIWEAKVVPLDVVKCLLRTKLGLWVARFPPLIVRWWKENLTNLFKAKVLSVRLHLFLSSSNKSRELIITEWAISFTRMMCSREKSEVIRSSNSLSISPMSMS